jgi:hypothetical protein
MERRDLTWDRDASPEELAEIVGFVAGEFNLQFGAVTELKTIRGSQHWHLQRAQQPGVLEVTLVANSKRGFISVHSNRNAEWIEPLIGLFLARISVFVDG